MRLARRPLLTIALATLMASALLAGCGGDDDSPEAVRPGAPSATTAATKEPGAGRLVRAHLAAVGRGDRDAYLAAVTDDTRFDIGGRLIYGRDAITEFFDSELSGGRYDVQRERPSADGVSLDLDFRRGGLFEELTYIYTVGGERISKLVARYR